MSGCVGSGDSSCFPSHVGNRNNSHIYRIMFWGGIKEIVHIIGFAHCLAHKIVSCCCPVTTTAAAAGEVRETGVTVPFAYTSLSLHK